MGVIIIFNRVDVCMLSDYKIKLNVVEIFIEKGKIIYDKI